MQVEEKKKDDEFERLLDGEQARLWKRDVEKYKDDQQRIKKIIRAKNIRNLEQVKEYSKAFWERISEIPDGQKILRNIDKKEKFKR